MQSRDIQLDGAQWERVLNGVDRAAEKGAKESLVMIDDVALVVSVRNRTVITAVDQQSLKENVFTNIDSAVIV
ncbi:MAG TPA: flagellar protein [Armatimonadetes bacterium]|jgi:flagellar operon protein|nr:flagellar protein [Armatimonadota bacterium]